jgi:hypothetical protein
LILACALDYSNPPSKKKKKKKEEERKKNITLESKDIIIFKLELYKEE